ncbi:RDD family protein [Janibacter terrae]|uniref:RDD family protein n=1 Tax=Janibacter terrae TaxID=103817 RepID=UPI0031FA39FC
MTDPTQGTPYGGAPYGGAPQPPTGSPQPPPFPQGRTPDQPGSLAWVEQRYDRSATFADRILPGIIDAALSFTAAVIPMVIGISLIVAGMPDTYDCGGYSSSRCEVPGSGSGALVGLGVLMLLLSVLAGLAMIAWNRVWRVTKTGQSIGKKVTGLKIINSGTGANPELGPAALRELVHQFAGIISWIWMLVDDDDRTLADIVGKTHVIHAPKA